MMAEEVEKPLREYKKLKWVVKRKTDIVVDHAVVASRLLACIALLCVYLPLLYTLVIVNFL
jgi:hypothetical protein